MSVPAISSHDWRRGFAFIGVWGGCVCTFAYICVLTYLLRDDAEAIFKLAVLANVHLFLGMLALGWFGGRRLQFQASRDGLNWNDREQHFDGDLPQPTFGGETRP